MPPQNPKSSYITGVEAVPVRSYQRLFESVEDPLLYSAPWWLDATCGVGGWNSLIFFSEDRIPIAGLPYQNNPIRGMKAITTPPLTQWVSLLSRERESGQENSFSLASFPKTPILDLSIKPDERLTIQDFHCTPALKYSFIIPRSNDMDQVRAGYNEGLRRNLRQARQLHRIEESDDLGGFLALCHQTYHDRDMKPPHWLDQIIAEVYKKLISHRCGTLTIATAQGKIIAGVLTAWDRHSSYYLAGGKAADEQGTAAHALILDQAIHDACNRGTAFDFEGSMHPGIANFFQSFGGVPVPYWHFRKYRGPGRLWSLLKK